jgi:seryl-tRNA synthetase
MKSCGFQPRGPASQVYSLEDESLCLIATSEITLAALYKGATVDVNKASRTTHVGQLNHTCHTSHLTPHTSHLTSHTSHLTPHTSHLTPHTSHNSIARVPRLTSRVTRVQMPINMVGFSHCFRREVGGAGSQNRGLFRLHQFSKVFA